MKIIILGASSGIGREFAKLLANGENDIIAISYDQTGLDALNGEIKSKTGAEIETVCRDLTKDDDLEYICNNYTDCDFLIFSIGGGKFGSVSTLTLSEEQYYMNLNMWALHAVTKTTLQKMISNKRGMLINVCSLASFAPMPHLSLYAATKAFTGSYTIAISKEVKKYGIKVMALCPGPTKTEIDLLPADFKKERRHERLRNRFMTPMDVARTALSKIERGGIICIPGLINKVYYLSYKFLPIRFNNAVIYRLFEGLGIRE